MIISRSKLCVFGLFSFLSLTACDPGSSKKNEPVEEEDSSDNGNQLPDDENSLPFLDGDEGNEQAPTPSVPGSDSENDPSQPARGLTRAGITAVKHDPTKRYRISDDYIQRNGYSNFNNHPRTFADFNGDGLLDIIGFRDVAVEVTFQKSNNTFEEKPVFLTSEFTHIQDWKRQNDYPRFFADVNGDGKADLVGFGNSRVFVSLSDGARLGPVYVGSANYTKKLSGFTSQDTFPRFVADVTGDGKADLVAFAGAGIFVSESDGKTMHINKQWAWNFGLYGKIVRSQNANPKIMADVNGDGKSDVVIRHKDGVSVALSLGNSFDSFELWTSNFSDAQGWTSFDKNPIAIADVNGDKKPDLIGFADDGVYVSENNGVSFKGMRKITHDFSVKQNWSSFNRYPRMAVDFDNNGKANILGFSADALYTNYID